jgi:hypothetical protein
MITREKICAQIERNEEEIRLVKERSDWPLIKWLRQQNRLFRKFLYDLDTNGEN